MFKYSVATEFNNGDWSIKTFKSKLFAKIYVGVMRRRKNVNDVQMCSSFR